MGLHPNRISLREWMNGHPGSKFKLIIFGTTGNFRALVLEIMRNLNLLRAHISVKYMELQGVYSLRCGSYYEVLLFSFFFLVTI